MLIPNLTLTSQLQRWLRQSNDDGQPELFVRYESTHPKAGVIVTRQDGSEPSESEQLEIMARLAAHAVK